MLVRLAVLPSNSSNSTQSALPFRFNRAMATETLTLSDTAGAGIANTDTIDVGPTSIGSFMSGQRSPSLMDGAATGASRHRTRSGSILAGVPLVSNWTQACHALRLPRWT
jgi:hypothetical protein